MKAVDAGKGIVVKHPLPKDPDGIVRRHPPLPFPPKIDKDELTFKLKDQDRNGYLSSDEYGPGKDKQDEFRRYDRNNDGKLSLREFKIGRLLDQLRDLMGPEPLPWPRPIPFPRPFPPDGGPFPKPVPLPRPLPLPKPLPEFPGGELKPLPAKPGDKPELKPLDK